MGVGVPETASFATERHHRPGSGCTISADMGGSPSLIMWPEPARYWVICAQLKTEAWQAGSFKCQICCVPLPAAGRGTRRRGGHGNQGRLGRFRLEILMLCPAEPAAKPSRRLPSSAMASRPRVLMGGRVPRSQWPRLPGG